MTTWTACVVCLNQRGKRVPRVKTVKTYQVCEAHVELVSQPGFDIFSLRGPLRSF
jgi:hypothetical protein